MVENNFSKKKKLMLPFYGNISPIKREDNKFVFIQRC